MIEKQKHDRKFAETMAAESHRHLPVKYIESLLILARDLPKEAPPKPPATPHAQRLPPRIPNANNNNQLQ